MEYILVLDKIWSTYFDNCRALHVETMTVDHVAAVDLVVVEVDSVAVEVNQPAAMQKMAFLFVMQMQMHEIAVDALKMTALP